MTLTGQNVMVVGVMPRGFQFPGGAEHDPGLQFALDSDVWMPLALTDEDKQIQGTMNLARSSVVSDRAFHQARRKQSCTLQQNLPLGTIGHTLNVVPLHQQMVGKIRKLLLVLLATVAFVLLIACANIANLLLVRATSRQRRLLSARRSGLAGCDSSGSC